MNVTLDTLCEYVEGELGFATSYYNESYLDRRVMARVRRTEAETYDEYFDVLRSDPEEADALLDALSINVTSFFRDPAMWERLRPVLRQLTAEHRRVDLWSAPCSDGREPYSMAMLALDDPEIDADTVRIVGTDISEDALATARRGRYETTKTTDIDDELSVLEDYSPYVDNDGNRFEVNDRVKELVTFERQDLIQDDPLGVFELVMCRNFLIYIAPEYKETIFETLDRSLARDGYLVIGMTETLPPTYKDRYESIGEGTRIHRRTG